jgi:hypothetical protein
MLDKAINYATNNLLGVPLGPGPRSPSCFEAATRIADIAGKVFRGEEIQVAAWVCLVPDYTFGTLQTIGVNELIAEFDLEVAWNVAKVSRTLQKDSDQVLAMMATIVESEPIVQTLWAARLLVELHFSIETCWWTVKDKIYLARETVTTCHKVPASLLVELQTRSTRIGEFVTQVAGNCPQDTPILSVGYPSCLGSYRVLASLGISNPLAVKYIDRLISEAPNGVGEPVLQSEEQVIALLRGLKDEDFDSIL